MTIDSLLFAINAVRDYDKNAIIDSIEIQDKFNIIFHSRTGPDYVYTTYKAMV